MGIKDTKAKEFLADNRRFADLCNYFLYDGEIVIKPEDLVEQDTTELLSVMGDGEEELQVQKWRDLIKRVVIKNTSACRYVVIGVENQTDIHYAMPVRNMIYDAINYGKQIKETAKRHRSSKDLRRSGEFLSGFSKEDKLIPVITLALYWGAEPWDAPRSIHEMFSDIDVNLRQYISDYRLNLIAPCEITDFGKFRTSLGAVLEMIKYSKDERRMNQIITSRAIYKNLEKEAVTAIIMFTGMEIRTDEEEETMDVCKAWVDHRQAGVAEGESKTEKKIILNMSRNGFSVEQIAAATEIDVEEVREIVENKSL